MLSMVSKAKPSNGKRLAIILVMGLQNLARLPGHPHGGRSQIVYNALSSPTI